MNGFPTILPQPELAYPTCYLIQEQEQRCICCNSQHHYTTVFAKTYYKSRMGQRNVTNLRALTWPCTLYNLPIERIIAKPVLVPFCHSCNQPSLSHFAPPPIPQEVVGLAEKAVQPPKAQPAGPRPKGAATPQPSRKAASLDSLATLFGG